MMDQFTIRKDNSYMISCVENIPEDPKGLVIAIHGFSSSKDGSTYQMLLKRLPEAGYGVVAIDLPGHGSGESKKETLRIPSALDSIEAAERYIAKHWPGLKICYFGSSFGAYLIGLYISTRPHAGRAAFFRSAAVNMPTLFIKDDPTEEEKKKLAELYEKGYFDTDPKIYDVSIRITREMYEDLAENDLFEKFDPGRFGKHHIAMAHGEDDTVIDPAEAKRFASMFDIPIMMFPGEGHSLSNEPGLPEKIADLAVTLYESIDD